MLTVCGNNDSYQILHETYKNIKIPTNFKIDLPFLSSISFYNRHTVWTTKDGKAYAIGSNREGRICGTLPREEFSTKRKVIIQDEFGHQCDFKSVVCGHNYTLYQLFSCNQFVYVHQVDPTPLFLTIEGPKSISLYGGATIAASIDTEGGILIFTPYLFQSNSNQIRSIKLPLEEKAIFVSCCSASIFVLSASGKVYESQINPNSNNMIIFQEVKELSNKKVVSISGTYDHCLAVCQNGKVYAKGSNIHNQLGIGTGKLSLEQFTLLESLQYVFITAVSAGYYHSLFQTNDGKIYACGSNYDGQLFDKNRQDHYIFYPTETTIRNGATFCIAGENISAVFIDTPNLPPHMSNMPIKNRNDDAEDERELDTRHDFDDYFSYNKSDLIKKLILLEQENEMLKSALKKALKSAKQNNYNILDKAEFKGYKIVREINKGGFGVVYEVEKEGKKYALKRLRENILDTRNIRGFKSEYKKINKLHHPNVIKTFGIHLEGDDTSPSFILEYCPQVLSKMVGNTSVHGEEIVIWLFQIAEAMKYIHKNEMVHLDLKPANILLDSEGIIKVSDFGISMFINPLERTTQLGAGTRFYAAPECLNFEEITEKFDVYSFGIVAFELLSGKLPIQEIKNIRVGKKCTFPSHFSSFARKLISQCCRFSPEERPSFEEILELFEENDYMLFNFKNNEVSKIKKFVVNHRKRIAKDSE